MSYDIVLRARDTMSSSSFLSVREQLQSVAGSLQGELFIAPSDFWKGGERVATLCLPYDPSVSSLQSSAWRELSTLAREVGLDLFDPQRGEQMSFPTRSQ